MWFCDIEFGPLNITCGYVAWKVGILKSFMLFLAWKVGLSMSVACVCHVKWFYQYQVVWWKLSLSLSGVDFCHKNGSFNISCGVWHKSGSLNINNLCHEKWVTYYQLWVCHLKSWFLNISSGVVWIMDHLISIVCSGMECLLILLVGLWH